MQFVSVKEVGMNNNKQYILLVNGDEITYSGLKQNLRADYEVIQIVGGNQTYTALQRYDYNVVAVILNMTKPFNKSFSIFKNFKKHNRWKHIPIIITTRIISPVTISAGNNFFFMCKNPFLLFGVEIA